MVTLNTDDPTLIPLNHFADTQNSVRRDDGLWEKRKGMIQLGDDLGSGEAVHSLIGWRIADGTRYITAGTDTDIYVYVEGVTYDVGTWTNAQSITSAEPWNSVQYRDILQFCNGVDDIRTTADNSTFTQRAESAGTVVRPKYMTQGNNFITFAGDTSDPDIVYLSSGAPAVADVYKYDSSNNQNIDIGNSYSVTGVLSLGDQIIVTKANQTYKTDLASLATVPLDFSGGCEDHRGILRTQKNSILIPNRHGVYSIARTQIGDNAYFGNAESEVIRKLWRTISDFTDIPGWFITDENRAIWAADSDEGRIAFVKMMDYATPVWTYYTGFNASQFTTYKDSDDKDHYLFADNAVDQVWEFNQGWADGGAPINSVLALKNDDFDAPGQLKSIEYADIYGWISQFAEWNVELYKNDEAVPFDTLTITSDNYLNPTSELDGLGSGALGDTPLGGIEAEEGVEVKAFGFRIPILRDDIEKMQIVLYNTQGDVRVVFRAAIVYYDELPIDNYPQNQIA